MQINDQVEDLLVKPKHNTSKGQVEDLLAKPKHECPHIGLLPELCITFHLHYISFALHFIRI